MKLIPFFAIRIIDLQRYPKQIYFVFSDDHLHPYVELVCVVSKVAKQRVIKNQHTFWF